jgi:hypothetical protein
MIINIIFVLFVVAYMLDFAVRERRAEVRARRIARMHTLAPNHPVFHQRQR